MGDSALTRQLSNLPLLKNIRFLSLLPTPNILDLNNAKSSNGSDQVAIINSCAADLINDETLIAANLLLSRFGCKMVKPNPK